MDTIKGLYDHYLKHPFVSTDTRSLKHGSIFFALKGEKFNANDFAEQALEAGCSLAVIDEKEYKKSDNYILVNDVLETLQELAKYHRLQLKIPVIGITGSNGKTTTKELIAAVLNKKYKTLATHGNLNNHIGVPLTLLSITKEHEMAVIEMGANHIGEIAMLSEIVQPDFGIITNIGKAHLEGFGSPEGVIKAKSELYRYIEKTLGTLFLNKDNSLLNSLASTPKIITYGTDENNDCIGKLLNLTPFVELEWKARNEKKYNEIIKTQIIGKYNFENILAAICIGNYFKVSAADIRDAIEKYIPSNNRSQIITKGTNTILLDAYNANPTSMQAALENFSELKAENKMLILGDMLELGNESKKEHKNIIEELKRRGFTNTILVGKEFTNASKDQNLFLTFNTSDEAAEYLKDKNIQNHSILIKGSRGIKLEKLTELL